MVCNEARFTKACLSWQGMLVTEMWMDRIAHMTEQPLQSIRQLNLYQEQDKTHYGQILHKCQVQVCTICIANPVLIQAA